MAMAKAKSIPYFATDEMKLQPIIDRILNNGTGEDILCVRIEDVILMMNSGNLEVLREKKQKYYGGWLEKVRRFLIGISGAFRRHFPEMTCVFCASVF